MAENITIADQNELDRLRTDALTPHQPTPDMLRIGRGSSNYNIDGAIYPADLMGDNNEANGYGNNCAIFYISVQEDSRLTKPGGGAEIMDAANLDQNKISELAGLEVSNEQLTDYAKTGATAAAAATGGAAVLSAFGVRGAKRALKALVGADVAAGFAANAAYQSGKIKRSTKSIRQAIALHMPTDLATSYSMGWDAQDTALGNSIIRGAKAYAESGSVAAADVASSYLASWVLREGPNQSLASTQSKLSATTGNPKKEQVFQGVDFRNFTFVYQFWPRNPDEAKQIQNIIRLFKLHMHPEFLSENRFLYLYPSEFDIRYYHREPGGAWIENLNIHRHTSCVLTNMSLNYAPQGIYSNLPGGVPTQINMTLQFKELALLTKETIEDGY